MGQVSFQGWLESLLQNLMRSCSRMAELSLVGQAMGSEGKQALPDLQSPFL